MFLNDKPSVPSKFTEGYLLSGLGLEPQSMQLACTHIHYSVINQPVLQPSARVL